ncbi:MAG: hypothetical protein HYT78_06515 [Deltaproteobacteria bacterium]|nr:hypothetical protein [Deltaproteobacteria bacterium]
MKSVFSFVALLIGLAIASDEARASTHDFYKGKTVRIVVGFSAGGGFDTYTRAIARHFGRHIPGNPTIIVENMPGAGSLISANHLYKVAQPDGLTIGHFIGGLFLQQLLGRQGVEFDARKFEYVGAPVKDSPVCVLTKASGVTSMEKLIAAKTPVKLGGTGPGDPTNDHPKILKAALDLPIQLVSGYKGTADVRLAAESGEVAGSCGWNWFSVKAVWTKAVESGAVVVVLQMMPKPRRDLAGVPLAINFAKTDQARQLLQAGIHDMSALIRPFTLPPGTPKDRVAAVRKAFMDTMRDAEFLADAKKSNLEIDPVPAEELAKTVAGLFELKPVIVGNLKEILK